MAEGLSKRKERLSARPTSSIDSLIERHPELELTSFAEVIDDKRHTLMFVAPRGMSLPEGFPRMVLEYQEKEGLAHEDNIGRRDCVSVAGAAVKALEPVIQKQYGDYAVGVMTTLDPNGRDIPVFKEQGFGQHAINFIEAEDGSCVSFDFTAHYNMDAAQGRYDVFAIGAQSEVDLKAYLKEFSGSSWD